MAKIKVFNCNQVGGNVTLISSGKTNILIDYGYAFPSSKYGNVDFKFNKIKIDAVLFTHYHYDHVGRFHLIPKDIPLVMGKVTKDIIELRNPKEYEENKNRIHIICDGDDVVIGDINVEPVLSDHSAFESFMYLIKTPDETILHTGDFRCHGYKNGGEVLKRSFPKIDSMILEGTRVVDFIGSNISVLQMQKKAEKIFAKKRMAYVHVSPYDYESVVAFYKGAISKGMRVICPKDFYDVVKTIEATAAPMDEIYDLSLLEYGEMQQSSKYYKTGFVYFISPKKECANVVKKWARFKPCLIFSERLDYIWPVSKAYKPLYGGFYGLVSKYTSKTYYLHTSGHAGPKDLTKIMCKTKPSRVIPIHTNHSRLLKLRYKILQKNMQNKEKI